MRGILIIAHGSREKQTEYTLNAVVDMVRKKLPDELIEISFMEFSDRTIEAGIKKLIEKGVDEVNAVPYFLFDGIHIREDIPQEINKIMKSYPDISVRLGKTLGGDSRLADILADRICGE